MSAMDVGAVNALTIRRSQPCNAEPVDPAIGTTHSCQCITECGLMTGTRSAEGIMASGHANRANRPNTWLHRPAIVRRDVLTCQPGAVHTWHFSDIRATV